MSHVRVDEYRREHPKERRRVNSDSVDFERDARIY